MNKDEVISCISHIKYGDDVRQSFDKFKAYLETVDLSSDEKWIRKLRKIIQKDSFTLRNEVLILLDQSQSQFFDLAMKLGICEKEVREVECFNQYVRDFADTEVLYDFCSGNGLNALYWNDIAGSIHLYDIQKSRNLQKVLPYLKDGTFHQKDINDDLDLGHGLYVSIHACGNLTDRVIDLAIENKSSFAVMPCCHDSKENLYYSSEELSAFQSPDDAINSARISRIKQGGYCCLVKKIPLQITPKNLVILGKPI